jgi:hypothetical protein
MGTRREFERSLQANATSYFLQRGLPVHEKYPYCLDTLPNWPANIIDPGVAEYIQLQKAERQARRSPFPLHKWVHHGLSSQAMLFNLVGPLVLSGDLEPLLQALRTAGVPIPNGRTTADFEYEDRSVFQERSGQPTSFDLQIAVDGSPQVFVECKLVEREFGSCSVFTDGDCDGRNPARDFQLCTLHRMGRSYLPLMKKHQLLSGEFAQGPFCAMAMHYQFFRELLFALEKGGSFVLLSDERSPVFQDAVTGRGRMSLLRSLLPTAAQARVHAISVQQVINAIEESGPHAWVAQFRDKYGLAAPEQPG